jgi:hypothetical protein
MVGAKLRHFERKSEILSVRVMNKRTRTVKPVKRQKKRRLKISAAFNIIEEII